MFNQPLNDFWSMQGEVDNTLNSLLSTSDFTLEMILDQNEIIQETLNSNETLINYLVRDDVFEKLVRYLVEPSSPSDSDLRRFKYPYMACQILSLSRPEFLTKLVKDNDQKYLDLFFTLLDHNYELDQYLAGYFEKILDLIFRYFTNAIMTYLNNCGIELFMKFIRHIYSYSIMQLVQRILLPHLPFFNLVNTDNEKKKKNVLQFNEGLGDATVFCNWSYKEEICCILIECMCKPEKYINVKPYEEWLKVTKKENGECQSDEEVNIEADNAIENDGNINELHLYTPIHLSDLLITIFQLSGPTVLFTKCLCKPYYPTLLLDHAFYTPTRSSDTEEKIYITSREEIDRIFNSEEKLIEKNISFACFYVLDSFISRLSDYKFDIDSFLSSNQHKGEMDHNIQESLDFLNEINPIWDLFIPYFPNFVTCLSLALNKKPTKVSINQAQKEFIPLGHHNFQAIKLIESLSRVNIPTINHMFLSHNILTYCINLLFKYDFNSILHLAIYRIFIQFLDIGNTDINIIAHILSKTNFLEIIIDFLGKDVKKDDQSLIKDTLNISLKDSEEINENFENSLKEKSEDDETKLDSLSNDSKMDHVKNLAYFHFSESYNTFLYRHSSVIGSMIHIGHSTSICLQKFNQVTKSNNNESSDSFSVDKKGDLECSTQEFVENKNGLILRELIEKNLESQDDENVDPETEALSEFFKEDLNIFKKPSKDILTRWDKFAEDSLNVIINHQYNGKYDSTLNELSYTNENFNSDRILESGEMANDFNYDFSSASYFNDMNYRDEIADAFPSMEDNFISNDFFEQHYYDDEEDDFSSSAFSSTFRGTSAIEGDDQDFFASYSDNISDHIVDQDDPFSSSDVDIFSSDLNTL